LVVAGRFVPVTALHFLKGVKMPQEIRIWNIKNKINLKEITRSKLDLEERIESWIENDISIISSNLLVIGRQVETDFGGVIDILCMN